MKILHKSKRALPPLPQVVELINTLLETPSEQLHVVLGQIDSWKWPRSDLNAWIKVLNKFDAIMAEIIRDYDIDKLQVNVFTPLTKKTLAEVLRFERLLLENSTNRKTFNSYDRLQSLMFTSDLDILILALNLLLRPAQQYSAQPAVSHALSISTPRLASLAKRWPNLREYDVNLIDLVGDKGKAQIEALPNDAREVFFTFYNKTATANPKEKGIAEEILELPTPQQTPSRKGPTTAVLGPSTPAPGSVTVHIDSQTLQSKSAMEILADAVEKYAVPEDDKLELLGRIRYAQALTPGHKAEREKLVAIRLLTTAIFGHTHLESQAQSSLFIHEPDLVFHIAELLQLDQGVDVQVQAAAVAALDSLGRYKGKIQEVLTAVNAGVNHGILMALLRRTISQVADPECTLSQAFVEALLAFVTFVATHASGGNMVVGAGLVPLLIQVIENRLPNRLYVLSKAMQLLDNVLYGYTNAFQLFCNVHGVEALVDRIEVCDVDFFQYMKLMFAQFEVDLDLEEHAGEDIPDVPASYGKLSVARGAVLKHIMRSMHRMMQSSGTSEGLRGLLDSSLLKSSKKIMEHRDVFGPNILPIAINIMATFVHNEATCLNVIQEAGLPDAFYRVVESGLEPVIEVIQSVPNAIGALCLNQTGQEQLAARPTIIPGLLSIFTSERHQRVLQEKENAVLIGTAIEELIRHHPSLKNSVYDAVRSTMGTIEELGNSFVVPEDLKSWYIIQPAISTQSVGVQTSDNDVPMEPIEPAEVTTQVAPTPMDEPPAKDPLEPEDDEVKIHGNLVTSYIDVFCKFLEGFFQHVPHCRDFITNADSMKRLGNLTALPCLPYDYPNSVASDSLVQVIRTMMEAATAETLTFLIGLVNESLAETKEFRETVEGDSKVLSMVESSGEDVVKANEDFRKLITLHVRIMLLSDVYTTSGYQGRATASLLQSLLARSANNVLADLGALHRACIWNNVLVKAHPIFGAVDVTAVPDLLQALEARLSSTGASSPEDNAPAPNNVSNGAQSQPSSSTVVGGSFGSVPKQEDGVREQNAKSLKHLSNQIPSTLSSFFQAVVRLFQSRRNPDPPHKQRILDAGAQLADVLMQHLRQKDHVVADARALFAYNTAVLSLLSILLFDERSASKTVHTVLLHALFRRGCLDSITDITHLFMKTVGSVSNINAEERSPEESQDLLDANSGLKIALHVIHPMLLTRPIFDSSQTTLLASSGKKEDDLDYFEAHNFAVKLRLGLIPVLRELWESSWLLSAPLSVTKAIVPVVLELLNTEGEAKEVVDDAGIGAPSGLAAAAAAAASRTVGPDEGRIRQLTDMGFPRSAAERALIRARNNVSAAAEILVANPFPLPPDPEEPVPAAEPEPEAEAGPEAEVAPEAEAVPEAEAASSEDAPSQDEDTAAASAGPSTEVIEPEAPATSSDQPPVPIKNPDEWLSELNAAREPLKDGVGKRALALIDVHPSLIFDVQRVFVGSPTDYRSQSVSTLLSEIKSFVTSAYDHQEHPIAVRCRLLALVMSEPTSPLSAMTSVEAKELMDILLSLLLSNPLNAETGHPTIPKWLASHLLLTEALLMLGEEPRYVTLPKEDEPVEKGELAVGPVYLEARSVLFDFCMRIMVVPSLPRDELLACLRLLVVLTRDHSLATQFVKRGGVEVIFQSAKALSGNTNSIGMHQYIAMLLRHIVEDPASLQLIMRQEVKRLFANPRNRLMDIGTFVRNCGPMALRDPHSFIQVADDLCQLSSPYSPVKSISMKANVKSPSEQTTKGSETDEHADMQVDDTTSKDNSVALESLDAVIHFLITELMRTVRNEYPPEGAPTESIAPQATTDTQQPSSSTTATPNSGSETQVPQPSASTEQQGSGEVNSRDADYIYACFLMQCLTELLFSYDSCKLAFLSYSPKKRLHTAAKDSASKHRTAALQFLINELMSFGSINPPSDTETKRQVMLCNWAMSVIVALCVDTFPSQDIKDVPADRISVRKFVLEAISRAVKDLSASDSAEVRYSRLLALSDLCYRLLSVRFNMGPRKANDETPTHLAKVMLEKNFVATLTNALSEVDLNYPNIRSVVAGILRPLEFLTKIAIRMSRVSEKQKDTFVEESASEDDEDSEEDEDMVDPDREETPDLYRNSSLGMYGGEMEDTHYGPDDEMDEDVDEEEDDVEMEYGDETGSEDTSATDEDDVDDLEHELEHGSHGSEDGWQDEEEDEEEGLVENDNHDEDDGEEGDEDEDEDADQEVMWQNVPAGDEGGEMADEGDDDGEGELPDIQYGEEEEDMMSEADEFGDELGIDMNMPPQIPAAPNLFVAGFPDVDGMLNQARGPPLFWEGPVRSTRRRNGVEDELDIFGGSRSIPAGPTAEGAVHPLLMDPSSGTARGTAQSRATRRLTRGVVPGIPSELMHSIENAIGEGAVNLFHHIISQGRGVGETIRIDIPSGGLIPQYLQRQAGRNGFSASIRLERAPRAGDHRADHRSFEPLVTMQRWTAEVKTLHGKYEQTRLNKLTSHVILALLPAAIEAAKKAKKIEEEEFARREALAKAEEEASAKEREEAEAKERADAERLQQDAEANAAQALEALAADAPVPESQTDQDTEMVDADTIHDEPTTSAETEAGPSTSVDQGSSSAPDRITVMIHGSAVDITDTGIDPTFLEALPDDMREEVLNQHVRDQRAARVERPADSAISAEFLDALPPELRAEIIQQESVERARRRTDQAAPESAADVPAQPAEMDPASFIASLDPQLRQVVLMDSDDVFIQSLPSHMIAEAGIFREQRIPRPPATVGVGSRNAVPQAPQGPKPAQPRDAIQLLDKPAIAVLIRLLFFPEMLRKNLLSKVLVNLCENARTRVDIFNLLLNILQDGTGDLGSIDKSFAQMSVRNSKGASPVTPKAAGKQRMQTDYFSNLPQPATQSEIVPELVSQRCLETLTYIVGSNELSSIFFLTEHELPIGLRRNASRKGKGKEKQAPQTHYPIVLLLGLLDRQSLLKTPSLMEYVVALLALVTRPLTSLGNKKTEPAVPVASGSQADQSNEVPAAQPEPAPTAQSEPAAQPSPDPQPAAAAAVATESTSAGQAAAAQPSPDMQPSAGEEKIILSHPPNIPHNVLRFVVNILTAGECSGRTFSHSLALIQHLSFIPDARDIIALELSSRAQEFGGSLCVALDELSLSLKEARSDDVTRSVASKFSPASSDQAKLLRVLKTIDYMYSPKALNANATAPKSSDVEKLQSIYESFHFAGLWRRLGECLASIEENPELEHIATVLLPLIESLMVVCKYVGSQASGPNATRLLRAASSPKSPTAKESMEELFVVFTDAHRKVLNLMVRNNPSLMSGSFSLLVHNPRVLDFDNKRNYFSQQLHRRPHTREHYSTLQLNVRRQRVFEDSFQYLQRKTGEQIKFGKLSIRFYDEEGVDAGGVTREWFQILARQMFDPNYALFQPCAADRLTYQPNRASNVNPEHLSFFKFVGRVIGKAIYDGRLLDAYFARSLYRQILDKPVDYRDVEWVDPEYYNSLCWILENDPSALELTFSVEADEFGVMKIVELKEGGATMPVTEENKREFVQLSAQYRLYSSIKEQIESLLTGFYEIIPKDLITIFDEKELELLISGTPDIDVDEWRAATEYNGYTSPDPVIVWWWRALKSFNREERAKVLSFATGTSRVPLGGFVELQGVQGVQRFSIHRAYGDTDRLPQAHTCFNQIDLPQYSSYEMLRQQLLLAIHEVVKAYAHPSKLPIVNDAPEPKPGNDQVLVDVYSAGLNFFDILQAQGKYQNQPPFPFTLGAEFAGRISADSPIPPGCTLKRGQRVFGSGQGAYADKIVAAWDLIVPLPDNMTFDQGAALGAKVIAAAGSEEKIEVSKKYGGADYGINYRNKDWQKEVMKITGGKGVNVIYDPVGMIRDCLKCIAWKGRAIVVGFAGGEIEKLPMNLVLLKNISVVGIHWGAYTKNEREHMPVVWNDLLELLTSGRAKPVIYTDIYPLEQYAAGLKDLEDRKTWGKAVIRVREDDSAAAKAKL
ncbi:hypothetical protein EUX98_g3760 [Antrodiella citrinella]|uniref:HECT-type E3 ubiquitin transferase n=1 Tax=Antrodiella citrinella TaxID=2447956 RepID=A0A4S4MY79_9APHY|nr:hypothetical protein EUX98_g3760 [Antrodiella citrinella]